MSQSAEYRGSDPEPRQKPWRLIIFAGIAVFTVVFILQNRERAQVDFLVFEINARRWTTILFSIALGVVLDRLFTGWWRRRKERKSS